MIRDIDAFAEGKEGPAWRAAQRYVCRWCFGGDDGDKKQEVQQSKADPWLTNTMQGNYNDLAAFSLQPPYSYTGQRVAGPSALETQAKDYLTNWVNDPTAMNSYGSAADIARRIGNYTYSDIAKPAAVKPQMLKDVDLSAYMNPYTQNVIDTTLSDLARTRDIQRVADNQKATAGKAFGGSRQGVADSLTNDAYFRNVASADAQLRSTAYDKAVEGATGDITRRLNADVFNTNTGLDVDKTNATNRYNYAGMGLRASDLLAELANKQNAIGLQRGGTLLSLGQADTARSQAQLDADYENWLKSVDDVYKRLGLRTSALTGYPVQSTVTGTTSMQPGVGSQIMGYGQLGLGLAGLGSRAFGIGEADNGWTDLGSDWFDNYINTFG